MNRTTILLLATMALISGISADALAETVPRGSAYDARIQQVIYNPQNVSVLNTRAGYVTTLIFDEDETVLSADPGFPKAWEVNKQANRVTVRPQPITQGAPGADGNQEQVVIPPNSRDWRSNLLVITNKRMYSLDLNVLDDDNKAQPAYVVSYRYPGEEAQQARANQAQQQLAIAKQAEAARTEKALSTAQIPRNWDYQMRVGKYSRQITPDFAWDDGRFTFLGFSPQKKVPSLFGYDGTKEHTLDPSVERKGSYTVLVVHALVPSLILRSGNAVVGVENNGYGKVRIADGDTVSPRVQLVEK
ncbi:P-type conjugative transfer protein VirB9 [Pantoea ananatis]|uniref:P-type conjugative transfer protein VirB9 n=1 Tax=Pantoea ananas TaxID=553 RepID=UPI001B30DAEB|nr:P-type conjugative transfer protein VirB9 [Pantoea ananatis]